MPAARLPAVDKSRCSKSVEVQRVWEIHDDRLCFMTQADATRLASALRGRDVSSAWVVWSSAAESALANAYCFARGPVPDWELVLGRGVARFRAVRLGGPTVRKVQRRRPLWIGGMFTCIVTLPLLLFVRRRLKVVLNLLSEMIRSGFSLARSLELTAQWDCVLRAGPVRPISGVIGFGRTPWFILIVGFVLTWCRLHPFCSVILSEVWCSG